MIKQSFPSKSIKDTVPDSLIGFNDQRMDPFQQGYHLGNGYRFYWPTQRRFNAPDSMSPFGLGGINSYVYCNGDPINNTDPSGHYMRAGEILGDAMNVIFSIFAVVAAVPTGGASLSVIAVSSAALQTTSTALVLTAQADEYLHPQTSQQLIDASIITGTLAIGFDTYRGWIDPNRENFRREKKNSSKNKLDSDLMKSDSKDMGHNDLRASQNLQGNVIENIPRVGNRETEIPTNRHMKNVQLSVVERNSIHPQNAAKSKEYRGKKRSYSNINDERFYNANENSQHLERVGTTVGKYGARIARPAGFLVDEISTQDNLHRRRRQ